MIDGASGAAAQTRGAPAISPTNFEGLSDDDNIDLTTWSTWPADSQLAVGPDHVFEVVNIVGRIYDKNGNTLDSFALIDFFDVPDGYIDFDPKVIYDAFTGRWFASYVSIFDDELGPDEALLHVAISQTSDPTDAWNLYTQPYEDVFPDYPGIGITNDKFTISADLYDIDGPPGFIGPGCQPEVGFCGQETIVIEKADVVAGLPAVSVDIAYFDPALRETVRPAHSLSPINDQYLVTFSTSAPDLLTMLRVTGTPSEGNVTEFIAANLTILPQEVPPPSITAGDADCIIFTENLGPPPCIESSDRRALEAIWRNDRLWLGASAACLPPGDETTRSCAHLIELNTSGAPSVVQDIMYGAPGNYYSFPALRTDAAGNLYVVVAHTNPSIFAEARVTGRLAGDPPNTLADSALLRAGEVVHDSGRWGDYLGAAVDPSQPLCVWVVGQFAKDTEGADWGTQIAALSYSGACGGAPPPPTDTPTPTNPPPTATPTRTSTPQPTATRTRTPTATPSPLFGDVSCNETVDSIDAALILQYGADLLSRLACPESADVNQDGSINSIDAALVLQYVAGLLPRLPP
ncbi:MAG: hypothetical protein A2148_03695 [Chloroflexi bacterium RBG_16_68_14]|nr:MAG: hypothetical protein A2148_03695 [Chloroflexi bacterium RBG_16_68_14]